MPNIVCHHGSWYYQDKETGTLIGPFRFYQDAVDCEHRLETDPFAMGDALP